MNMNELKSLFITGIRPKTLVAAIIPPLVAHGLYFKVYAKTDWYIVLHCLGLALFIQMATNFYNDAVDFKKGADDKRVGPKRITNEQTLKSVFLLGHLCLFMAFMFGIPLVIKGGTIIFFLGIISLYLSYGYTGGPFPLAYMGLGELFVFLFFGLLATGGSYYLIDLKLTQDSLVLSLAVGFLSCALISINNFRDRKTDKEVGKNTLATKFTDFQYKKIISLFLFAPYLFLLYFVFFIDLRFFFVIFAIRFGHRAFKIVKEHKQEAELNLALNYAGKHLLVFGALFIICCL